MNKHILFVDDDKNLLQGIQRVLRMQYEDVIADFEDSPANAIKRFDKNNYNVIVSDYQMPGINGGKLLELVKERRPEIIRIILTGYLDDAIEASYNDQQCYYIKKPVVISELMYAIEVAMKESEMKDQ